MAERQGTGGRGGLSVHDGWDEVSADATIFRSRTEPSPAQPVVKGRLENLGYRIGRSFPNRADAEKAVAELRRAGSQLHLVDRKYSLKIVTDPSPLKDAPERGEVKMQVFVIRKGQSEEDARTETDEARELNEDMAALKAAREKALATS